MLLKIIYLGENKGDVRMEDLLRPLNEFDILWTNLTGLTYLKIKVIFERKSLTTTEKKSSEKN